MLSLPPRDSEKWFSFSKSANYRHFPFFFPKCAADGAVCAFLSLFLFADSSADVGALDASLRRFDALIDLRDVLECACVSAPLEVPEDPYAGQSPSLSWEVVAAAAAANAVVTFKFSFFFFSFLSFFLRFLPFVLSPPICGVGFRWLWAARDTSLSFLVVLVLVFVGMVVAVVVVVVVVAISASPEPAHCGVVMLLKAAAAWML